jgi:hypothetical protein
VSIAPTQKPPLVPYGKRHDSPTFLRPLCSDSTVPLALISTSWVVTCETHCAHLTTMVVAQVDRLLLLCDQLSWMDQHILELTFLWHWIYGCLSQVRPWRIWNHLFQMRGLFFFDYVEIEQPLDFLEWSEPTSRHLSILLARILDFLQSDSRTTEFYTSIHTMLHTEPSRYLLDNCCCIKILHMTDSCPNFIYISRHKLSTCLLESD